MQRHLYAVPRPLAPRPALGEERRKHGVLRTRIALYAPAVITLDQQAAQRRSAAAESDQAGVFRRHVQGHADL